MSDLNRRLASAIKRERGLRLTAAEAIRVAHLIGVEPESESNAAPRPAPKPQKKQPPINVHVRWLIRRDFGEVLDIEQQCFEFPWPKEEFIRTLSQSTCIGMVAEFEERVVGFFIYELRNDKVIHILNLAVAPEYQLRSVGSSLLDKVKGKLTHMKSMKRIALEVRETNMGAIRFCAASGFRAVATIRDFYGHFTDEDAIEFQYALSDSVALTPLTRKQTVTPKPADDDDGEFAA